MLLNHLGGVLRTCQSAQCTEQLAQEFLSSEAENSGSSKSCRSSSLGAPAVVLSFSCQLNRVQLFETPWTAARQAPLSPTISRSVLKFMPTESVTLSHHLVLCCVLLLLLSIFPSLRIFSNESALCISDQNTGASASASVLPVNSQVFYPDFLRRDQTRLDCSKAPFFIQ